MKNVFVLVGVIALAGCSSASGPSLSSGAAMPAPMIYVQSARQTDDITSCLHDRASSLRVANVGNSVELGDGREWLITLTPSGGGSTVAVQHATNVSENIPEPEMRFDIARCTI